MKIPKKLYRELSPKQRAIAAVAACNRNDQAEIDRIMSEANKDHQTYKAIRALQHGLQAYNMLMNSAIIGSLLAECQLKESFFFCAGWRKAGGSLDDQEFLKNLRMIEPLSKERDEWDKDFLETQVVAFEWCEKHDVPNDFFSGPLSPFPLPSKKIEVEETENLELIRSAFNEMTFD